MAVTFQNPVPGLIYLLNPRPAGTFILTRPFHDGSLPQYGLHDGWDIGNGRRGDPVLAMAGGEVTRALFDGLNGGAGIVRVRHAGGYSSGYAHLQSIKVKPGQWVRAGQQLGTVGDTGWADAPHLHFDISLNDQRLDPRSMLAQFQPKPAPVQEDDVNEATEVPAAVCDIASGGTLYTTQNRGAVLIRNWGGADNVGLYSLPTRAKVGTKAALARIRVDMAGGGAQDLRSAWVGVDKIRNVRAAPLPR